MSYAIVTKPHTAMIRVTARLNESRAYIRRIEAKEDFAAQKQRAWSEQWFGFLPEPIFIRLLPILYNRFGQYPRLVSILKAWLDKDIENHDFKLICNFHMQLTDPYYRWVSGVYLPVLYEEGFPDIAKQLLIPKLNEQTLNPLRGTTLDKLARNILTTARDVGLIKGKQQKLFDVPVVSIEFFGYFVYTLQLFDFPMADLPASPYARAIFRDANALRSLLLEGQRKAWWEFNWGNQLFALNLHFSTIEQWFESMIGAK